MATSCDGQLAGATLATRAEFVTDDTHRPTPGLMAANRSPGNSGGRVGSSDAAVDAQLAESRLAAAPVGLAEDVRHECLTFVSAQVLELADLICRDRNVGKGRERAQWILDERGTKHLIGDHANPEPRSSRLV